MTSFFFFTLTSRVDRYTKSISLEYEPISDNFGVVYRARSWPEAHLEERPESELFWGLWFRVEC